MRRLLALATLVSFLASPLAAFAQNVTGSVNLRAVGATPLTGANIIDGPSASVRVNIVAGSLSLSGITGSIGATFPKAGAAIGFQ
ncbi:MAG: hypothetical protein EPO00_02725, partial [Chloroflexota bacterium]